MIDATYKISTQAKLGTDPERLMYIFTEALNSGRDVSVPENAQWIADWVSSHTHNQITLHDTVWPSFGDIVKAINRGHIAIGGFDDYVNLRDSSGKNPYSWNDPHGLGHVLLVVGYDDVNQWVAVHDPLQGLSRMPRWYSFSGFQAAGFHDLIEVNGPALDGTGQIALDFTNIGVPSLSFLLQALWGFVEAILQYVAVTLAQAGKG